MNTTYNTNHKLAIIFFFLLYHENSSIFISYDNWIAHEISFFFWDFLFIFFFFQETMRNGKKNVLKKEVTRMKRRHTIARSRKKNELKKFNEKVKWKI